jgi:hypothetical protein
MALTRPNLTIQTVLSEKCTKITVQDITGAYNATTNPLGYGLPNGIALTDITSIVIDVYYPSVTVPITYTITQVAGTPTALTVTDLNGTVYDIFADIATLYVAGVFNLTGETAFTLPKITDGIFNVVYTISGIDAIQSLEFNYTTNKEFLSTCSIDCCILNMYQNLDMCCDCSEDAKLKIQDAEVMLTAACFAIESGNTSKAQCLLDKSIALCDNNCTDC